MDYDRFAVLITFPDGYSGTGFLVLQTLAQFVIAYFGVLCLFLRMAKICVICSQDCSNEPRFKDEDGHYVCASCYETQDDTEATTTNFTVGEKAAGIAVLLIIIVICGSVIWRFREALDLYFAIVAVGLSLFAFIKLCLEPLLETWFPGTDTGSSGVSYGSSSGSSWGGSCGSSCGGGGCGGGD